MISHRQYVLKCIDDLFDDPHCLEKTLDCFKSVMEQVDEKVAVKLMLKVHCALYGYHFNKELAQSAVAEMRNADGTVGEIWTLEETNNIRQQHHIDCNEYDLYYGLNMLCSDLYPLYKKDVSAYVKIFNALYLDDIDSDRNKLFKQFLSQNIDL